MDQTARTRPGADLLALAAWLADNRAPLRLVHETGFLAAPLPERLGGLGVSSPHDLVLAWRRFLGAM